MSIMKMMSVFRSIFYRGAAISLALLSVLFSHKWMSAESFELFNMMLFILAICSAIYSPINRMMWTGNFEYPDEYPLISNLIIYTVILFLWIASGKIFDVKNISFIYVILFFIYGFFKFNERFIYSNRMIYSTIDKALLIVFVSAFIEFISIILIFNITKDLLLEYRLLVPAFVFLAIVLIVYRKAIFSYSWKNIFSVIYQCFKFTWREIFSKVGVGIMSLTIITTLSAMADRVLMFYFDIFPKNFESDYLLVLAYAISIQTVCGIFIDISRRYLYFEGRWGDERRKYIYLIFSVMGGIFIGWIAFFPILNKIGIIPDSISWQVWVYLIVRALALFFCYIAFVDYFQIGKVAKIILTVLLLCGVNGAFLFFAMHGFGVSSSAFAAAVATGVILIALIIRFWIAQRSGGKVNKRKV